MMRDCGDGDVGCESVEGKAMSNCEDGMMMGTKWCGN